MRNIEIHSGAIKDITHVDTSYCGNPRYSFMINDLKVYTPINSLLGYSIGNYLNKKVVARIGEHYNKVTLKSIEGVTQ